MKSRVFALFGFFLMAVAVAAPANAKEGVIATVHTGIPVDAAPGTELVVNWTLSNPSHDEPFTANDIYIRLIGPDGSYTESFADGGGADQNGNCDATVTIPDGA